MAFQRVIPPTFYSSIENFVDYSISPKTINRHQTVVSLVAFRLSALLQMVLCELILKSIEVV